jgi:hypothetical protein
LDKKTHKIKCRGIKLEKIKKVTIKRMRTKLDKRIKWNKMLKDEIKKKSTETTIKSKTNSN